MYEYILQTLTNQKGEEKKKEMDNEFENLDEGDNENG